MKKIIKQKDLENLNLNRNSKQGLVDFKDEYALLDDETPVSVIVIFNNEPAETKLLRMSLEDKLSMSASEASILAMQDHDIFQKGMDILFPTISESAVPAYTIDFVYTKSLNGVAVTLPSSKVKAMAEIESVNIVLPNKKMYIDPVDNGQELS